MRFLLVCLCFCVFGLNFAVAQKFGYFDSGFVLSKMPEYAKAQGEIDQLSAAWQHDARKRNKNGFFNNTIYRLGLFYSQTNLFINNTAISNKGFTLSFSMPTPGKFAYNKINFGFTFGEQGTEKSNLITHKYIMANVGILFGDIWFKKSKID